MKMRRTILALAVVFACWNEHVCHAREEERDNVTPIAGEKLDMSFMYGGGVAGANSWTVLNGHYIPGRYLVDLSVNGQGIGKHILNVTEQDSEELCLTQAWLTHAGVSIDAEYFREAHDATRLCWVLGKAPAAKVEFDVSTQSLELSIPQKGLQKEEDHVELDYGTNAFRMDYNANANTGRYSTSAFASTALKANIERWVVSSSAMASSDGRGNGQAEIAMFTASRALQEWSADLALGKTSTGDALLGSIGTYGVSLSRNNSMKPGNLGYAPVFSGIANGPSRVTLMQNGRVVYSEMVSTGPFAITDVSLYSSGDVTMTIVGDDGSNSTQIFPLSVVSGQLSPGMGEFSLAAGWPEDNNRLDGGVFAASYGYGLDNVTLRANSVANQDWLGGGGGAVVGLGSLGAVSADGMVMSAKYRDGRHGGNKIRVAWSKQLASLGTGLQLSSSRRDVEYEEISSFDTTQAWGLRSHNRRLKDEWNVGVSQPVADLFNLSLSGWQRGYYPGASATGYRLDGRDLGVSGSLGTQIQQVGLNVGVSGSRNPQGGNWGMSLSVSVPLTWFDRPSSNNTTVSSSNGGGVKVSTGVSGSLNDRLNYSLGGGRDGAGGSSYINAAYAADAVYLGGAINNASSSGTSGSIAGSGSVLAVPSAGVVFSRTVSNTVALVRVKDTPGVKLNSADTLGTDAAGNLVVPLNSYNWNTVTIDAGSLPQSSELSMSSQKVVPANGAVVLMSFDPFVVHRYLLQIKQKSGEFVSVGVWARDSKNTPLGFVANNGVLMINAVDALGDITLGDCRIPAVKLQETEKLQEITCE
ncbi:TPA: PefC/AfrB family outer membrane usher protein [Aeromonas hydrophila]|uniref:PefC/AfrB family outer membrane usher protein n=1 Tax=Aeromonas hydrophila TaxID=644 RepID=UPI0038CFE5A5